MKLAIILAVCSILEITGCGCPLKYAHTAAGREYVEAKCSDSDRKFIRWANLPGDPTGVNQ